MLTVALALLLAGPVEEPWTREPEGYREVRWGAGLAEAAAALGSKGKQSDVCNCEASDKRQRSGACAARAESDPSKVPTSRVCIPYPNKIADALVHEVWRFGADRFEGVLWTFDSTDYEALRDVLVERYGPPTGSAREAMQTPFGATVENERFEWVGRAVSVGIWRYGSSVGEGVAHFTTNAGAAEQLRAYQEKQKAAAKSF